MEATAKLMYLRITPRKVRIVANIIRGQKVGAALSALAYVEKRAAEPLAKLLRSAVANAEQAAKDGQFDADKLVVKELMVDQGPTLRRFMPRAMGRAFKVLKKTSHISLTVADDVVVPKKLTKKQAGAKKSKRIAAATKPIATPKTAAAKVQGA